MRTWSYGMEQGADGHPYYTLLCDGVEVGQLENRGPTETQFIVQALNAAERRKERADQTMDGLLKKMRSGGFRGQ